MSEKYKCKSNKYELSLESTDQTSLGWDAGLEQGWPQVWLSGDIAGPINVIISEYRICVI